MSKNTTITFTNATVGRPRAQRSTQESLEPRYHALGMPSLAVDSTREPFLHLTTITSAHGLRVTASGVYGDDCRTNAQLLAAKLMVRLGVVSGIGQQPIDGQMMNGLPDDRFEIGSIVRGTGPYISTCNQVSVMMAKNGQFRPAPILLHPALAMEKVPADVMAFQAGGIDAGFGLVVEKSSGAGGTENGAQELIESSFFKRRCSA